MPHRRTMTKTLPRAATVTSPLRVHFVNQVAVPLGHDLALHV